MASMSESNKRKFAETDENCEKKHEIMPGYSSVNDFTKDGFKILMEATRNANSLPQDSNWDFYKINSDFNRIMNEEGANILRLINNIIKEQGAKGSILSRDIEEKIELIIETNDSILERVADNIDELSGIRKNPEIPVEIQTVSAKLPVNGSWNRISNNAFTVGHSLSIDQSKIATPQSAIRLLTAKNIMRPQQFFKDKIDNSTKFIWQPRIKDKPNSMKPLAIYLEDTDEGLGQIFCHPYEIELDRFEPKPENLKHTEPIFPKPVSETTLKMVTTEEELNALVGDLRNYKEIAVDLEHHSYRTFLGITCLMQISTLGTDYIIDTLVLRDKLCVLNEIFTKPSIVKVFHGADQDILWLQRDLSLYIVNMFDTHQAAKQLDYPHLSLGYLLKKFCDIEANKHFQLADWRIRPLPEELILYAREDTHYLLYIYHMLKNALLKQGNSDTNVLKSVFLRSTNICKKRYVKPILDEDSHMDLYRRCKKLFDNRQMFAFKMLYKWRDTLARNEDESIGFVLPNHMLLQIAEVLPREMQGVLACCNPIPPLVRSNLLEIHKFVLKARDEPLIQPILSEEVRSRGSTQKVTKFNIDSILNCPHDIRTSEFRDDLPTLFGSLHTKVIKTNLELKRPTLEIFDTPENSDDEQENEEYRTKLLFLAPYERYKLVKPYIQAEEDKKAKEIEDTKAKESEEKKTNDLGDSEQSNKTDEERINLLHDHFKAMAANIPQLSLDASIEEKKRKRCESEQGTEEALKEEPKLKLAKVDESVGIRGKNYLKNQKKKMKKLTKEKEKLNKGLDKNSESIHQQENYTANKDGIQQQNKNLIKKQKKERKQKKQQTNEPKVNFDYSSVNFQQFQGGGSSVYQQKKIKTKFSGKGNKKKFQGSNFNKSSLFEGPKMPGDKGPRRPR